MKVQIDPRNYDAVSFSKEDFAREGVEHDDVEFNVKNNFTATISGEVFEVVSRAWGKKFVSEVKDSEPNSSKK